MKANETTKRAATQRRTTTTKPNPTGPDERMLTALADGWTISSTTFAELFNEVETLMLKLAVEPDVYVILSVKGSNRFVQALIDNDNEPGSLCCETVDDAFLGTPETGPRHTPAQIAALIRDKWIAPSGTEGDTPNWHRVIRPGTMGAAALASQLLVSTLIDVHGVGDPSQLEVTIGPRDRPEADVAADESAFFYKVLHTLELDRSYSLTQLTALGFTASEALSLSTEFDWGGQPHPPIVVNGNNVY